MTEPTFTTREEAVLAAELAFLPPGIDWDLTMPEVTWEPERQLLTHFGALPATLHFGATELDLRQGEVRFVDQDHRDGADFVVHRAALPEAWLTRLRSLER
jgi:hypothetical protein